MSLRDELLNPIPGANPAGENLRYAPTYDKIKEARREEDEGPQGDWKRERKVADWPQAIKLLTGRLAYRSSTSARWPGRSQGGVGYFARLD